MKIGNLYLMLSYFKMNRLYKVRAIADTCNAIATTVSKKLFLIVKMIGHL